MLKKSTDVNAQEIIMDEAEALFDLIKIMLVRANKRIAALNVIVRLSSNVEQHAASWDLSTMQTRMERLNEEWHNFMVAHSSIISTVSADKRSEH